MFRNVLIWPLVVVVCCVFCGCDDNSKHNLELPALPQIPPSKTLTLSQQQLVYLDWHSSSLARAKVTEKRIVPPTGVEFDIYFPGNDPVCDSIQYVSSGQGGRGVLPGSDVRGYETFALSFTLISINRQKEPNDSQKIEVGALIGPTPTGELGDYKLATLSLLSSENSVVAKTPMRTNKIYQIGFYVRLLEPEKWNPAGSEIVLRIDPVQDAGFVPVQILGQQ
jgi:hypothetical protein